MAAIVVVLFWLAIGLPGAEAQESPSIVGSFPLSGLSGATEWLNSSPLTVKRLKGKVVLIDF